MSHHANGKEGAQAHPQHPRESHRSAASAESVGRHDRLAAIQEALKEGKGVALLIVEPRLRETALSEAKELLRGEPSMKVLDLKGCSAAQARQAFLSVYTSSSAVICHGLESLEPEAIDAVIEGLKAVKFWCKGKPALAISQKDLGHRGAGLAVARLKAMM